jgi:HD-GYP domain-containing protein (c-di-GMP phosphodiesterase class II)
MKAGNPQAVELGERLITALHHMMSTMRIYQDNNALVKDCAENLSGILSKLSEDQRMVVGVLRGRLYIQGEKLPFRRGMFNLMNEVMAHFSKREIGELCINRCLSGSLSQDLVAFMRLLNESVKYSHPRTWLQGQLKVNRLEWIEVSGNREEDQVDAELLRREMVRNAYFKSIIAVKEVAEKVSRGIAGVRKARRLAQMVVDIVQTDDSLLLGLVSIRDYDDYTYAHSVNVAILATCLGKYIGLSRLALENLMICGLFHDLGKVEVSKDILLKEGKLNSEEWDIMRSHTLIGVRKILRLNAPYALKSKIILGPFEHHLNPDLSGYPQTRFMKKLSLMGKILRITDVYEALTAERTYRPRAFTPDEALRLMWSERGKNYDTALLKCFIGMMGLYPVGSLVELESGEKALVMEYPDDTQKSMPLVLLLRDDGNGGLTRGEMVNLAAQGTADPQFRKRITRGLHPARYGIKPAQFFLQSQDIAGDTLLGAQLGISSRGDLRGETRDH